MTPPAPSAPEGKIECCADNQSCGLSVKHYCSCGQHEHVPGLCKLFKSISERKMESDETTIFDVADDWVKTIDLWVDKCVETENLEPRQQFLKLKNFILELSKIVRECKRIVEDQQTLKAKSRSIQ